MIYKYMLASALSLKVELACKKKIRRIKKTTMPKSLQSTQRRNFISYWKRYKLNPSLDWIEVYQQVSGVHSVRYVSEDIYYILIEPVLNFKPMAKAETCKTKYHANYPLFSFPKHIMVNENGVNYNAKNECIPANEIDEYLGHISVTERELITKPSLDSGGGAGVRKFVWNTHAWVDSANNRLTADLLSRLYNRDFVVQSCVSQHTFLSQFNETSVNTIRVLTYRSVENESIHILHSLLRIGKKGSITDNQASGGISVGISDQGKLNGFAVDKYGNKFYDVNGVKLSSAIQVPQFDAICFEALKLAKELRYSRLLGLDLTINELGEIIVIEINNVSNEINFYQMNNGPLFGSFTDEVLEYCSTNLRSICIDYSL